MSGDEPGSVSAFRCITPYHPSVRVAAFQFDVRRGDVEANVAEVERGLRGAAADGAQLVVLPEMWPTSFVVEGDDERWVSETNAALDRVRELSRELELVVCGSGFGDPASAPDSGSSGSDRLRNRLTVFDQGRDILTYDKVHLFSLTAEHVRFGRGHAVPRTVDCRGFRLSGIVCYDLRFSSILRAPFVDEAELLVVPAQWPDPRRSHWRALVVGRAVEHQAFVVATNRTGRVELGRRGLELGFPGNSLIVSPHGQVLAEGAGDAGWITADIELEELRALRKHVPVRADECEVSGNG